MNDIETLLDLIISNKVKYLNVDDFQYGEWQKIVPDGWTIDRYFSAMNTLEDIFDNLSMFAVEGTQGSFPITGLYIKYKEETLWMYLIEGQGSDFIITKQKPSKHIILDWDVVLQLKSMSEFEKAIWYVNNKCGTISSQHIREKLIFRLAKSYRWEDVNKNNLE